MSQCSLRSAGERPLMACLLYQNGSFAIAFILQWVGSVGVGGGIVCEWMSQYLSPNPLLSSWFC